MHKGMGNPGRGRVIRKLRRTEVKLRKTLRLAMVVVVSICLPALTGCAWMMRTGVNVGAPMVMGYGIEAFYEETDPVIAEAAAAANLKILEMLLKISPDNEELLAKAAMGLVAYGMSFAEYDMEKADLWYKYGDGDDNDKEMANYHRQRARRLYLRARAYGFHSLSMSGDGEDLVDLLKAEKVQDMEAHIKEIVAALEEIDEDQLPALFWTTAAWALYLNLSRDDVNVVGMFPVLTHMIARIKKIDSGFFFGMPHMFDAMLFSMPAMLGGDKAKAHRAFTRVDDVNRGGFLLGKVLRARFYCTQFDEPEEGVRLLREVLDADDTKMPPKYNLMNVLAKRKAALYIKYTEDLF